MTKHAFYGRLKPIILGFAMSVSTAAVAQDMQDVKPSQPLKLSARGSFFVGGTLASQTPVELGSYSKLDGGTPGKVAVNQMYVEFMKPARRKHLPIIMLHGASLTGKSFDTTPDGRMGWYEYFVRRGFPAYLPDYVGRGRSGFNQAPFNSARAGTTSPSDLPAIRRFSDSVSWTNFRFGPSNGVAFADGQFPLSFLDRLAKQGVPDLDEMLSAPVDLEGNPNPVTSGVAQLTHDLGGAVVMGHSQGGLYPVQIALQQPEATKGIIMVESCGRANQNEAQIKTLSHIPMLAVWGDHIDTPTGIEGWSWRMAYDECEKLVKRVNDAGGNAQIWFLPDLGHRGNSHMLMMDRNNLEIADLIIGWISKNVDPRR